MGVQTAHYQRADHCPTFWAGLPIGVGKKEGHSTKTHSGCPPVPTPLSNLVKFCSFIDQKNGQWSHIRDDQETEAPEVLPGISHTESVNISLAGVLLSQDPVLGHLWLSVGNRYSSYIIILSEGTFTLYLFRFFFWSSRATIWSQWLTWSKGDGSTRSLPEVTHYLNSHEVGCSNKVYSLLLEKISYNGFYFICFPLEM